MRRSAFLAVVCAAVSSILFVSCFGKENHISVADNQLDGTWVKDGTEEYWLYDSDTHSGVTWDEADDISRQESNLTYTWSLNGDVLTHVFNGAMGNQAVPKVYTITEIDNHTMKWSDDFGLTYILHKSVRI